MPQNSNATLTGKQKRFVDEYLIDLNATRAYKEAYVNVKNDNVAAVNANRLLSNAKIKGYIAERMKERATRTEITQDRVLQEYAKIAFFNPKHLFNANGQPKDITELDDETAAVIAGLEVNDVYEGFGEDRTFAGYLKKYKIVDKKGALDSLARHLGMFTDKIEVGNKDDKPFEIKDVSLEDKLKLIDSLKGE